MDKPDSTRRVISAYLAEAARDARRSAGLPRQRRQVAHLRDRQRRARPKVAD